MGQSGLLLEWEAARSQVRPVTALGEGLWRGGGGWPHTTGDSLLTHITLYIFFNKFAYFTLKKPSKEGRIEKSL